MTEPAGSPRLLVEGLEKTFNPGTVQHKRALDGVSLSLQPGEFAIVIGSNGAGKSTTLAAIAGELTVDKGHVSVSGTSLDGLPASRRARYISRVFQDPMRGTAAALTIEENLAIASHRGRRRRLAFALNRRRREVFRAALQPLGLGLENRLGDRVELLSGGQRQSLTLTMATLSPPDVLLLDEHTAALDPRVADVVVKATLDAVKDRPMATMMVTHNMDHAIAFGDRLLMMHEGRIILDLRGREKRNMTTTRLIERFHDTVSDRMVLR